MSHEKCHRRYSWLVGGDRKGGDEAARGGKSKQLGQQSSKRPSRRPARQLPLKERRRIKLGRHDPLRDHRRPKADAQLKHQKAEASTAGGRCVAALTGDVDAVLMGVGKLMRRSRGDASTRARRKSRRRRVA